jgi:hypothetical protein
MKRYVAIMVAVLSAGWILFGVETAGATTSTTPLATPQRVAAEEWVGHMNTRNLRATCELEAIGQGPGQPCAGLPTQEPSNCPVAGPGAKPPYRRSEIRTAAEQVGDFTEESLTRGYFRLNAQVKARGLWGALGLEVMDGAWRITYLRYATETFAPAFSSYQSEGWHKLWVSNWCPTNRPQWKGKEK